MAHHHRFKPDLGHRPHSLSCGCCAMSRRSFLGAAAACTAALASGCSSLESLHTLPDPRGKRAPPTARSYRQLPEFSSLRRQLG